MCDPITVGTAASTSLTATGSAALASAGLSAASTAGAALVAATPGALATTAATSGLFGSAGVFSLGTTFQTLSTGFGVLGQFASSANQQANLEYQAQMAEYRRKIGENNALMAEYQAAQDADLFDDRLKSLFAAQDVTTAKSNVLINQDTPLEIKVDTAAEGAAERLAILHGGSVAASAARLEAQGEQFAAANFRANAGAARTAGFINAAASGGKFFGTGAGRGLLT